MKRGSGPKRTLSQIEEEPQIKRQSTRGNKIINIPGLIVGTGEPTSTSYGHQQLSYDEICRFVETKIHEGAQVVSLPTPPDSHSIFVNVINSDKVMICDWEAEKIVQFTKKQKNSDQWRNYTSLINCLKEKYHNVEYNKVDKTLYDIADAKHIECNEQGGCSTYMYLWINKYFIKDGEVALYQHIQ